MKRHFVTHNSIAAAVIGGTGAARLCVESWATMPYLQRETSVSPTVSGGDLGT